MTTLVGPASRETEEGAVMVMNISAVSTGHAASLAGATGSLWDGRHHPPSSQVALRVLGDIAIIAVTLALATLVAFMLFAPTLL
jgi:hypothetical protein